jgi:FkbM family methyltransferase
MFDKIIKIKEKGYTPDIIFDIGAYKGTWTDDMLKIYPDAEYLLFEAIDYPELKRFSNKPNFKTFNTILNEKETIVDWYEMKNTGDSFCKEMTWHFKGCIPQQRHSTTLNKIISNNQVANKGQKILIKIDCQGAEIPILKGCGIILDRTDFIILEIPFFGKWNENTPSFLEHINFMDSIGFIVFDIADLHIINGYTMQIDMIFINKNHNFIKDVEIKVKFDGLK